MKDIVKRFSSKLIIITSLFVFDYQVYGQEKVNLSTGFGMPELLNIGVRFQLDQLQIGFSIGSIPFKEEDENLISIISDFRYHFGGFSELSNRRPWYGSIGLNYFRDETEYYLAKYLYLNNRIGREFNISNKFGIAIDAGVAFALSYEEIRKKPRNGWGFTVEFPVLPSLGIGLFYRFNN